MVTDRPSRVFRCRPVILVPAFAMLATLVIALRIYERGELWLDRTYWLLGCATFAAAIAAPVCLSMARWKHLSRSGVLGFLARAFVFSAVFVFGMMIAYAFYSQFLSGHFEPNPERPIRGSIFGTIQVMVLFLISCPAYLLPWPLPALAGVAAWLFRPQPVEHRRPGV
jgi:hypothetical protein